MREIKFRVWNGQSFRYLQFIPTMGFVFNDFHNSPDFGEDYPQQFTGLQDAKGVDVYEGDIIQYKDYSQVIEFKELSAGDCADCNSYGYHINPYWEGKYEVIGNIYENPELVE